MIRDRKGEIGAQGGSAPTYSLLHIFALFQIFTMCKYTFFKRRSLESDLTG